MNKLPTRSRSRPFLDSKSKSSERSNEQIRELAHTLVNRLTAIHLCCFSVRRLLSRRQGSAVTSELDRIEAAVEDAAKLVQTLNNMLPNRRPAVVRDLPIDKQNALGHFSGLRT